MFLVAWWLTGVFLGWFIRKFYRAWKSARQTRALDASSAGRLDVVTRALVTLLNTILAGYGFRIQPHNNETEDQALARPSIAAPGRAFAIVALIALLAIGFAAATDHAQLDSYTLIVKMYLTGVRVQALIVGVLSGLV